LGFRRQRDSKKKKKESEKQRLRTVRWRVSEESALGDWVEGGGRQQGKFALNSHRRGGEGGGEKKGRVPTVSCGDSVLV